MDFISLHDLFRANSIRSLVSDGESDQTVVENTSPVSVRKLSTPKFSLPEKNKTYGGPVKSTKTYGGDENLLQQPNAKSSKKTTKEQLFHIGLKMYGYSKVICRS